MKTRTLAAFFAAATIIVTATAGMIVTLTPTEAHPRVHPAVKNVAAPVEVPAVKDITVAAYGDSITAWIDRADVPNTFTWVNHLGTGVRFEPTQGWAKGGAKLAEVLANATPVTADVLIIAAGTNDLGDRWGTPMGTRLSEIDQLVILSNPKRVILDAVPPLDSHPEWAIGWNAQLQQLAALRGWEFFDPWVFLRTSDGHYLPGTTVEGIHPSAMSQIIAGANVTEYLAN